jgi:streptomycin 6-kinase
MVGSEMPVLDGLLRDRLGRRFGVGVNGWLDELPPVLASLAERWELSLGSLIQRGSVSVVLWCRTAAGAAAVLKVSPDRRRIVDEADALAGWPTSKVPAVFAVDRQVGGLLIEAIRPGAALDQTGAYPGLPAVAELVTGLHREGPAGSHAPVTDRVTHLFDAGRAIYQRRPGLREVVPLEMYENGRRRAMRLAAGAGPAVVLHGDLTPANVLDGGPGRGLVAVDPTTCVGDPAFDLIDLLLWNAWDRAAVTSRATQLAPMVGVSIGRTLGWCAAFAPMTALELAEDSPDSRRDIDWLLAFAEAET